MPAQCILVGAAIVVALLIPAEAVSFSGEMVQDVPPTTSLPQTSSATTSSPAPASADPAMTSTESLNDPATMTPTYPAMDLSGKSFSLARPPVTLPNTQSGPSLSPEAIANNTILTTFLTSPRRLQPGSAAGQMPGSLSGRLAYGLITVRSAAAQQFHYLRQDLFMRLGASDAQRVAALPLAPGSGPNPVGGVFHARQGENYVFVPLCGGRLHARNVRLEQLPPGRRAHEVALPCL